MVRRGTRANANRRGAGITSTMTGHPISSLADGGNVAGARDRVLSASSLPSTPLLGIHSTLLMVLFGFQGGDEPRFQQFLMLRNLSVTTVGLNIRSLSASIRFLKFLRERDYQLAVLFAFFMLIPVYINRILCRKEWADDLGFGILFMINCRSTAYSLLLFGLGDIGSDSFAAIIPWVVVPVEALLAPICEHMPVKLVWPFHYTFWVVMYLRNDLTEPEYQCNSMLIVAGCIVSLAIRVSMDIIDRRAYLKEDADRHAS